jgi:hypothetical protein
MTPELLIKYFYNISIIGMHAWYTIILVKVEFSLLYIFNYFKMILFRLIIPNNIFETFYVFSLPVLQVLVE